MDAPEQSHKISKNNLRRFSVRQIVRARVHDHFSRFVRKDNAVGEMYRIGQFGAAEPAVDDRQTWKIGFQAGPEPNARTAHKNNAPLWWRIGPIAGLKGGDVFFPLPRIPLCD